jgi:hypothetical protein
METTTPKYNRTGGAFRKIMALVIGAQIRDVDIIETGFTGRTDLIVAPYSVINNGLQRNNRFHIRDDVVKVDRISQSVRRAIASEAPRAVRE